MGYRAVIFDLGGVVLDSPLHAIARYERDAGIPDGFVNRLIVANGTDGAWSKLERGELTMERFLVEFDEECAEAGQPVSAAAMMAEMRRGSSGPRPRMLAAIRTIRARGLKVGALTNNWVSEAARAGEAAPLRELFHAFVESSVVGLRKPDPRIYTRACAELSVEPAEAIVLDDIGRNLKPARALGMHTIKVADPDDALAELEAALGFAL